MAKTLHCPACRQGLFIIEDTQSNLFSTRLGFAKYQGHRYYCSSCNWLLSTGKPPKEIHCRNCGNNLQTTAVKVDRTVVCSCGAESDYNQLLSVSTPNESRLVVGELDIGGWSPTLTHNKIGLHRLDEPISYCFGLFSRIPGTIVSASNERSRYESLICGYCWSESMQTHSPHIAGYSLAEYFKSSGYSDTSDTCIRYYHLVLECPNCGRQMNSKL